MARKSTLEFCGWGWRVLASLGSVAASSIRPGVPRESPKRVHRWPTTRVGLDQSFEGPIPRRKHLGKGLGIWRAAPRAQRVRVARSARPKKILSPHDPYTRSPLRKARRRVRTEPLTKELYQKPTARERCARGAARQLRALRPIDPPTEDFRLGVL